MNLGAIAGIIILMYASMLGGAWLAKNQSSALDEITARNLANCRVELMIYRGQHLKECEQLDPGFHWLEDGSQVLCPEKRGDIMDALEGVER